MRLVRLLTAGKSLVGVREGATRFRINRVMLPRFAVKSNPFATAESGQTKPSENARAPGATAPAPETSAAAQALRTSLPELPIEKPSWLSTVKGALGSSLKMLALRLDSYLTRANRAAPAIPPVPKLPVQRELSLDKVKVVRNDLSDSDVEVVPANEHFSTSDSNCHEPATNTRALLSITNRDPGPRSGETTRTARDRDQRLGFWPPTEKDAGPRDTSACKP